VPDLVGAGGVLNPLEGECKGSWWSTHAVVLYTEGTASGTVTGVYAPPGALTRISIIEELREVSNAPYANNLARLQGL
jgi:hypothetical protein